MSSTDVAAAVRIDLEGGEHIYIRKRRGWAAHNRVQSAAVGIDGVDSEGNPVIKIDLLAMGLAEMETAIVSWSLDLPVSRAGFESEDFDPALGDEIVKAIQAYYRDQGRSKAGKGS